MQPPCHACLQHAAVRPGLQHAAAPPGSRTARLLRDGEPQPLGCLGAAVLLLVQLWCRRLHTSPPPSFPAHGPVAEVLQSTRKLNTQKPPISPCRPRHGGGVWGALLQPARARLQPRRLPPVHRDAGLQVSGGGLVGVCVCDWMHTPLHAGRAKRGQQAAAAGHCRAAWLLSAVLWQAWASSGVPPRVVDGPAGCSQRGARQLCASKCRLPTGCTVTAVPSLLLRHCGIQLTCPTVPAQCRIHEVEDAYYADKEVRWAVAVKQQTCSCGWWAEHTDPLARL